MFLLFVIANGEFIGRWVKEFIGMEVSHVNVGCLFIFHQLPPWQSHHVMMHLTSSTVD